MRSILALLLPLALLAGCAAPSSSPVPEDPAPESPSSSVSPDDDAPDGTFFDHELSVTVAGGRTLTLVAHCKETVMEGFSAYGTGTIDVLDGEELLQTLHVGEGVLTLEENPEAFSEEVYPTVFESFYLPTLADLNFDGAQDVLCMCDMGTVNGSYLCWLWDPAQGRFTAGPGLCGYAVEPDPDARQVSVSSRGGWGTYDTDIYVPDEHGALVHVKNIHQEADPTGSGDGFLTTVSQWQDGQWVIVS